MLTPGRVRLNTEPGFFAMETLFDMMCDTHCCPSEPPLSVYRPHLAVFFLSNMLIFICMKLKDILKEISEDVCERLPNESEADFLTRCGNQAFARLDKMRMDQTLGTYTRNVVKETHDRKELELTRLKLMNQAFKLLPNSPKQLAVRKEI